MIILYVGFFPLSVPALHLRHLPDTNHDHVGRYLQRGRHQQPGRLHWGAHGARGGAGRAARGVGETRTHGGPSVGEQRVHHHQEEEEPAHPEHHPEHARHWQILPDDFPGFLHLLQPHLLVCLLLKDTRSGPETSRQSDCCSIQDTSVMPVVLYSTSGDLRPLGLRPWTALRLWDWSEQSFLGFFGHAAIWMFINSINSNKDNNHWMVFLN